MDEFGFLYTWDEWYDVLEDRKGICFNCNIDVAECPCYTWQIVEIEGLSTVKFNDRDWVNLSKEEIVMNIAPKEYQDNEQKEVETCDCCGCTPCDCDWGN